MGKMTEKNTENRAGGDWVGGQEGVPVGEGQEGTPDVADAVWCWKDKKGTEEEEEEEDDDDYDDDDDDDDDYDYDYDDDDDLTSI